jgi:hypothetical protein
MIIAVVVAFALGAGAGGFAEHERLKNTKHTAAAPKAAAGAGWFARPAAACPALKSWETASASAYVAILKKAPWTTTRTTLLAQQTAATAAMKTLLKYAKPKGKTGLNFLIAHQTKTTAALQHASSQADYSKADTALASAVVKRDNAILARAAGNCPKT